MLQSHIIQDQQVKIILITGILNVNNNGERQIGRTVVMELMKTVVKQVVHGHILTECHFYVNGKTVNV